MCVHAADRLHAAERKTLHDSAPPGNHKKTPAGVFRQKIILELMIVLHGRRSSSN
jgi:hypothetical protein